jgi:hypothetical protein
MIDANRVNKFGIKAAFGIPLSMKFDHVRLPKLNIIPPEIII